MHYHALGWQQPVLRHVEPALPRDEIAHDHQPQDVVIVHGREIVMHGAQHDQNDRSHQRRSKAIDPNRGQGMRVAHRSCLSSMIRGG